MRTLEASVAYEGTPATLFYDDDPDPLFGGWGLERGDGVAIFRPLADILNTVTDEESPAAVRQRTEDALLTQIKKEVSDATTVEAVQASVNRANDVLTQVRNYERNIEIFVQRASEPQPADEV